MKKLKYNNWLLVLLFLIFPLFSGCSSQQQINQKLIIQGIAVDENEQGFSLAVQALDFQNPSEEDEPGLKVIEIKGISVMDALNNMDNKTSLTPVYSQNLLIIINETIAKRGVSGFIDFFIRHCETRPKVKLCVTEGSARDILNLKVGDKPFKVKDICDLIPPELNSDILHFVSNLKNQFSDPYTALLKIEDGSLGKEVALSGIALFSGDILTEFLKGDEAFGFMALKGVAGFGALVADVGDMGTVTGTINKSTVSTAAVIEGELPTFNINLNIGATTFSLDKNCSLCSEESVRSAINQKLSDKIQEICSALISKAVSNSNDVFNFGRILKNSFPDYFKNLNENWSEFIKKCSYNISCKVELTLTGKEPV